MNINDFINDRLKMLLESGIDSSVFEIKLLLAHILGIEPKNISPNMEITEHQAALLDDMLKERCNHRPIDKIIGKKGFYKYDFAVSDDVLSPRYDTEILVEKAIELLAPSQNANILELGVGSGCIILSVLADLPFVSGVGIDVSDAALAITDLNAENLKIEPERLNLLKASWFYEDIIEKLSDYAPFDMVVSNPPYIATSEIDKLDIEVKDFDPLIALDGGADGLKDYNRILQVSEKLLKPNGIIILEAGDGQQLRQIKQMAEGFKMQCLKILKDLNNIDRCIILKK